MNNFLTELLQPNSAILNAKIFKNDFLKIPATMSYNIEINLVEFEIENQKINTSIYLDFIRLNIYNLQELENSVFEFPINPKAGFIDGSIYLFDVHNPVDVSKIEFFSIKNNTLAATIYFSIDFEYENTNYCKVNNCELKLILQFGELSIDTDIINAENFDEKEVYELVSKTSYLNNYEKYQIKESEVTFKINRYPSN